MNDSLAGTSVGVIGLGVLGAVFAKHLAASPADTVHVYDLDSDKTQRAAGDGAVAASTPSEVLEQCQVVVLSLPNPAAVEAVFSGPGGLLEASLHDKLVIDTSTVDPQTNRAFADRVHAVGGRYVDAPVSGAEPFQGGMDGAIAGSLTFMVGGTEEEFASSVPVFEVLGRHWFHLGPSGAGSTVKLISNLCSGLYVLVTAEAFALGNAAGVKAEDLLEVFKHTDAKCYAMTDYLLPRTFEDRLAPGFSIKLQLKDHKLAEGLAQDLGVMDPMNRLAIDLYEQHVAGGLADRDVSAVVSRSVAGLEMDRA